MSASGPVPPAMPPAPAPGVRALAPTGPRLFRRPDHAILGGVAAGIAEHVRLPVRAVRIAFIAAALAGGLGVALYGAYWIVLPAAPGAGRSRVPQWLEYTAALLAVAATVAISATLIPAGAFFVPILLACIGGALIWRQASDTERLRIRAVSRTSISAAPSDRLGRIRLAAGVLLVVSGAAFVLARANVSALRDGVLAVVVTLVGVALLTGPWWIRVMAQLSNERTARIRSQERAELAAHLHDSVLQTLALIQRNADAPREVVRLARGQERELRALLYGRDAETGALAQRLRAVAGEVEDSYAVPVEAVVVGDAPLDERLSALAAATREALVNAAKHSGAASISLYAEVETQEVMVFVKDRGTGFDPDAVAEDRQGLRGSVLGRVERHGGTATVRSVLGTGTEVELRMPR